MLINLIRISLRARDFQNLLKKDFTTLLPLRGTSLGKDHIKLPKIGKVKYFNSRTIVGKVKTATVVKEGKDYFVCIVAETEKSEPIVNNKKAVGIDVGIVTFAVLSDGNNVHSPFFLEPFLKQLRLLQRKLSRQKRDSKSRDKTKEQISKLYKKIANSRLDFLHKTSTTLANNYSAIYIEDLNLQKMHKTALGTLSRKLSDSGFGMLKEQLKYKMRERGKHLGLVNPAYTSQTCSECKVADKKIPSFTI